VSPARHHQALPEGFLLHWYEIRSVLGQGGFGITYLARDTNLDQPVAVKEFLPVDLATRADDGRVHPVSEEHAGAYEWGMDRFLKEARTLAQFKHPNIVQVYAVFEANNTAYMVMEYEQGRSLADALRFQGLEGEAALRAVLEPILDGLERIHAKGFIHRDIKPDNIYLRDDGSPVLLDFGSARQAAGSSSRTLTALVSPGYAPFEQYDDGRDGETKQGPWTDIYALAATMYRAVAGTGPADAIARANAVMSGEDILVPAVQVGADQYSRAFLAALDRALAFHAHDRPQSIAEWRAILGGDSLRDAPTALAPGTEAPTHVAGSASGARVEAPAPVAAVPGAARGVTAPARRESWYAALAVAVVILGAAAGGWWYLGRAPGSLPSAQGPARVAAGVPAGQAPAAEPPPAIEAAPTIEAAPAIEVAPAIEAAPAIEVAPAIEAAPAVARSAGAPSQAAGRVEAGRRALAAMRLGAPPGDNATEHFTEALALEPGNADALAGLRAVAMQYLGIAERAVARSDRGMAAEYLDKADAVLPGSGVVRQARTRLIGAPGAPPQALPEAGASAAFTDCERCPLMVAIPGGTFVIGEPDPASLQPPSAPVREVAIAPFAIGRDEVTFGQWDACVSDGGCTHRPDDHGWGRGSMPVVDVSFEHARKYVQWLSAKAGRTYRLPSEAEWEYVARGGSDLDYPWGAGQELGHANCWNCLGEDQPQGTMPVGSFAPSALGVHDLAGNAWEWVEDCWNASLDGAPADGSARTDGNCSLRVLKGGSWTNEMSSLRSANRTKQRTTFKRNIVGFRVARSM
jgi:formylglycine-generating enzyme required for sulfatase activity